MIFTKYQGDCEKFYNIFARGEGEKTDVAQSGVKNCEISAKDLKKEKGRGIMIRINYLQKGSLQYVRMYP